MYNYFYIKTDCFSNTWDTAEIMRFLRQYDIFTERPQGDFFSQTPFISVSLMRVKNIHSWSSNDFDPSETNYISIITTETSCDHPLIKEFLKDIEKFLGYKICQDEA